MTPCYCLTLLFAANSLIKCFKRQKQCGPRANEPQSFMRWFRGIRFPRREYAWNFDGRNGGRRFAVEALEDRLAPATVQAVSSADPSLYVSSAVSFVNTNIRGSALRSPESSVRFHFCMDK